MLKKTVSSLLIIAMLISSAGICIAAEKSNSERVILSTGFSTRESLENNSRLYADDKGETIKRAVNSYLEIDKKTENTDPYFDVDLAADIDGLVLEADFSCIENGFTADLFKVRYEDRSMAAFVTVDKSGTLRSGANKLGSIGTNGKFTKIKVLYKADGSYTVYINGELKKNGSTGKAQKLQFVRCQLMPDDGTGKLLVDNLKIYSAENGDAARCFIDNDFEEESGWKSGFARISPGEGNTISRIEDYYALIEKKRADTDPYIDIFPEDTDTYDSMVISADLGSDSVGAEAKLFWKRSTDGEYLTDINLRTDGSIFCGEKRIGKIAEGEENRSIAVIYDFTDSSCDVYVDGEKKIDGAKTGKSGMIKNIRFQLLPGDITPVSLKIDNLKVYEGASLRSVPDTDLVQNYSTLPDSTADVKRLTGCVAYHTAADTAFYNGEKHRIEARPFAEDGRLYIPNSVCFPFAPNESGEGYSDLAQLCEKYNKSLFYDETGLIVISDGEFRYKDNKAAVNGISTYLFSERPGAAEIKALYQNSENRGKHPRLLADGNAFEQLAAEAGAESRIGSWIESALKNADDILLTEPCTYRLQEFRLNAVVHKMLERIITLGFAYRIGGEEKYAARAWEEMNAAIAFPDWNPQHFLDTAEMTFAVAAGYDLCYDYIAKIGKTGAAEQAIITKGLNEGEKQYRGYGTGTCFVYKDMNWNAVCNAGMAAGALAVMDSCPEYACGIIQNSLRSLDYILPSFAPSGGWDEGFGYWKYTVSYLARMVQCLDNTLGTDFNIPHFTGISETGLYAVSVFGKTGSNNYHDSGEDGSICPEMLWLGNTFNNSAYTSYYIKHIDTSIQNDYVWRCLYYDKNTGENECSFPADIKTDGIELATMCGSYDDDFGLWLSFHGGKNNVNHTHYDEGTFVLDMLGERWACDLGSEPLSYLGTSIDKLYRSRAEGHNTVVINPGADVGQEKNADCKIERFESIGSGALAVLNMSSALSGNALRAKRGFMVKDNRRTAVIQDKISLKAQSEVYWFMHTAADVYWENENTAVLSVGNKRMQLKAAVEGGTAELYTAEAAPLPTSPQVGGQADNAGMRKIVIKVSGSGDVKISVRLTPYDEEYASEDFAADNIDSWSLESSGGSTPPKYKKEYIVNREPFDMAITTPENADGIRYIRSGKAVIGAKVQNSSTVLSRGTGIGGKKSSDGCIALTTEAFSDSSKNEPFINVELDNAAAGSITAEFQIYNKGSYTTYVQLIDASGKTVSVLEIRPNGTLGTGGGLFVCGGEEWHNIAITTHGARQTADIFVDGRKIAEDVPSLTVLKRMKIIAFYPTDMPDGGYSGIMAIDNICIYSGEKEAFGIDFFNGIERTEDISAADNALIRNAEGTSLNIYAAQYDGSRLARLDTIKSGETERIEINKNYQTKIFVWNKYSFIPHGKF